jgi:hypothetical protein
MDGFLARDPRVAAILNRPDEYFDRARARAWQAAVHDVVRDLERRESRRRNGAWRTAAGPAAGDETGPASSSEDPYD